MAGEQRAGIYSAAQNRNQTIPRQLEEYRETLLLGSVVEKFVGETIDSLAFS